MQKNYFEVDENETVGSFLKEINEKKNMQYIILNTIPKSFVDVRTIALKMHQPNEKLKGLKKPISLSKGSTSDEHLAQLIESGDRVVETVDDYFDYVEAMEHILDKDYSFLDESLENIARDEIYALNEDDMIATAKRLFIQKRINLLPVIDSLNLVGEVRVMDLLANELINEKQNNRANLYDENYESSVYNLPIINIMNSRPLTVDKSMKIRDALRLMKDKKLASVIVTEGEKVYSIVSYKDVFKKIKKDVQRDTYTIEYSGSGDIFDDDFDLIQDFVEKSMKKISKISSYDLLKVSFKVHGNTDGTHQKKASVKMVLSHGNKVLHVSKEMVGGTSDEIKNDKVKGKWNVPQLVQDALKVLDKKVKEEKKK